MLLADQSLLVIVSETGELVLLKADPKKHEELGRFQAIKGKTWNHHIIAHGRLYVRNAEEMACYEMGMEEKPGVIFCKAGFAEPLMSCVPFSICGPVN
jgi:outer membrane protein assembly factor BamB